MRISEIRLQQFRLFRSGLHVTGLEPGLNIFHGPNESGKSTLAHAIRVAFLERHSAGTHDNLLPWDLKSAGPEIHIDFDYQGRRHQLTKQFMRQARCELRIDGEVRSGEDAELYLAGLMGFTLPSRGTSRPDQHGVPGLLWIAQGEGHELHDPVKGAREHVQGVLGDAMGHIASTDGDRVLQTVTRQLERLHTRGGKPRAEFQKAIVAQERLQSDLQDLDAMVRQYCDDVDELARLQQQFERDEAEQPWREMREKERIAREELARADAMREQLEQIKTSLEACRKTQALLHQRLETFRQRDHDLEVREQALKVAQERHQSLASRTNALRQATEQASQAYAHCREQLVASRQARLRQDKHKQLAGLREEISRLGEQQKQAEQILSELESLRQRAAAVRIDPAELKKLGALHARHQELEIRQQTVATRLQFDLLDGQALQLGDTRLTGRSEQLLLDSQVLDIPGYGTVRITPGGDDVADLAREQARVQQALDSALQALQVQSLEQAQQRAAEHAQLESRVQQLQGVLAVHAPDGPAVLAQRRSDLVAQAENLQAECEALADGVDTPALPVDIDQAQLAEQRAEQALKHAEVALQDHLVELAKAREALDTAHREVQLAKASADNPEAVQSEKQTLRHLNEEVAREASLQPEADRLDAQIRAVRPELLEQDIRRYSRSATQAQEDHAARERTIHALRGRLQAWGAEGLEERQRGLQGELAAIRRRVDEFERQARALTLLRDLLEAKRQELTRQLNEPLREKLMHYLHVLFSDRNGDLNIVLGDDLMPVELVRNDSYAALDTLSFGAREQVGLISRLAYADLLKEAGQPTLIMLDDALVHSDSTRLSQMKRILFDAAQRHQILLFTCHPERWRDMGVTARAIRDLVL